MASPAPSSPAGTSLPSSPASVTRPSTAVPTVKPQALSHHRPPPLCAQGGQESDAKDGVLAVFSRHPLTLVHPEKATLTEPDYGETTAVPKQERSLSTGSSDREEEIARAGVL